jgi:hypothetical protein
VNFVVINRQKNLKRCGLLVLVHCKAGVLREQLEMLQMVLLDGPVDVVDLKFLLKHISSVFVKTWTDEMRVDSAKMVAQLLTVLMLSNMPCVSIRSTAICSPLWFSMRNGSGQMRIPSVSRSSPPRQLKPSSFVESMPSQSVAASSFSLSLGRVCHFRYRRKKLRMKDLPVRNAPATLTTQT